jgi:hypothetical protein
VTPVRLARLATLGVVAVALAACDQGTASTAASRSTTPTTPPEPSSPVVGEWERINSCDAFLRAFERAGLDRLAPEWLVTAGYFVRADQMDPADPCRGAVDDRNSYFFEPSGRFGSLDQDEVVVDHGTYAPLDESTIVIVGASSERRFRVDFHIMDGRIRFHVPLPVACAGECRDDLAWVLSMFYPGALTRTTS